MGAEGGRRILAAIALGGWFVWSATMLMPPPNSASEPPSPVFSTTKAQNGAIILRLTSPPPRAAIYYTTDGTIPTTSARAYQAPFLVASNLTVKAITVVGRRSSPVNSFTYTPNIPPGVLVWSDEFNNASGINAPPDPHTWTFDTGKSGFGNHELETYCPWDSNTDPCSTENPNVYVGTEGFLHIIAREWSPGVYTSARIKSQNLFSFQYGRLEFRAQVPETQGFWPAAWLLGNNIAAVNWPACGEMDVLERVNGAAIPDWNEGSIHGIGFTGTKLGTVFKFPSGQKAAEWHTYGMIWKKGSVAYYVDDPRHPYVVYTPGSIESIAGARWPFDDGEGNFILLNLAVGGDWPGSPNASTRFPSELLVDYVRIYTN
jgi:beta-glucanase (GH16 family)